MARRFYTEDDIVFAPHPTHPWNPSFPHPRFIDRTGKVVGRLTVLGYAGHQKWWCLCKCGRITCVWQGNLRRDTNSCGCLAQETTTKLNTTHGKSHSPEYVAWNGAKMRCQNPNEPSYPNYGGRGVSMCDRWKVSFSHFLKDIGPRPTELHSLERLDNNGNYCPDNCVWADLESQMRNRRNTVLVTQNGETKPLAELCGGSYTKQYHVALRLLKKGWCDTCALLNSKSCSHV